MKITIGKAKITPQGDLRCQGPRVGDPTRVCNKLLCKANSKGFIAGDFVCTRCKQHIIVEV